MARELKTHVVLRESAMVMPVTFGPGDSLPDWALEKLEGKDHLFEVAKPVGEVVLPAPKDVKPVSGVVPGSGPLSEPAATEQGRPTQITDEDEDGDDEGDDAPPKRNASAKEWAEWAKDAGVPVTEGMGRDDIITAAKEAGVLD
ncbi:hypothetical protein [Nocardia phage NC1]|jgi:hypothetical protein|nr:hypothetical protein [Nocardia phage NC1]QSL67744.1 hypothetical protein [Nocardia phage P69]